MYRDFNEMVFHRSTYDTLAWLGDVGGIIKASLMIGDFLIGPLTGFLVTVFMMPYLFYYKQKGKATDVS